MAKRIRRLVLLTLCMALPTCASSPIATGEPGPSIRAVRVWSASDLRHPGGVERVSPCPNARFLSTGCEDCRLYVSDAATGSVIVRYDLDAPATAVTASAGGVACGFEDGRILFFFPGGKRWLKPQRGYAVRDLKSIGSRILSASEDGRLDLYSLPELALERELWQHPYAVERVAVDAAGQFVAAGANDGWVRVWRTDDWEQIAEFHDETDDVQGLAFHGAQLLVMGSCAVSLWDFGRGTLGVRHEHGFGPVTAFAPIPGVAGGVAGDRRGGLTRFEIGEELRVIWKRDDAHLDGVTGLAIVPVEGESVLVSGSLDSGLRLLRLGDGASIAEPRSHLGAVLAVELRESQRLLSADATGRIILRCGETSTRIWEVKERGWRALARRRSDGALAVAYHNRGIALLEDDAARPAEFDTPHRQVLDLAWAGDTLLSCGLDGTLCFWEIPKARLLARVQGHATWVKCVAASRDGKRAASGGSDGLLLLWNLDERKVHRVCRSPDGRLQCHERAVYDILFARDGSAVFSCGADGLIAMWDFQSAQQIRVFGERGSAVVELAELPQGHLASIGEDRFLRVWDVSTGAQVACRRSEVLPRSIATDGWQILVGYQDGAVGLLEVLSLPAGHSPALEPGRERSRIAPRE